MLCFKHAEMQAVGLCKCCLKGLCPSCLTDLGYGLACSEKCTEQVASHHQVRNLYIKQGDKVIKYGSANAPFILMAGILIAGVGAFYIWAGYFVSGLILFLTGIILILWGRKLRSLYK